MREALVSLPGVEKDSVKVDFPNKKVTFKVQDTASFKVDDAIEKIDDAGFTAKKDS